MNVQIKEDFPINKLDLEDETYQSRISYHNEKIKNLADDIKRFGQREPIGIQEQGEKFQIIYGFQRIKALLMLHQEIIKAAIYRELTERETRELCIRDNEMHGDLTNIERALHCEKLKEAGWSIEELCASYNTKKSAIYNWLKITDLDDVALNLIHEGYFSIYHGLELLKQKDFSRRLDIIKYCLTRNWSVRDIKKWIEHKSVMMSLSLGGWIDFCPVGPSWKPLYECKKCKYHHGVEKKGDHTRIECAGFDSVKLTPGVQKFIEVYQKHHPNSSLATMKNHKELSHGKT